MFFDTPTISPNWIADLRVNQEISSYHFPLGVSIEVSPAAVQLQPQLESVSFAFDVANNAGALNAQFIAGTSSRFAIDDLIGVIDEDGHLDAVGGNQCFEGLVLIGQQRR